MELLPELFQPLHRKIEEAPPIARPSVTYWQDAWRRFKKNGLAMTGLFMIVFLILIATFGPMLSPYTYSDQDLTNGNRPPTWQHWFGTDLLGRDLFTRVLYGARISLSIGFVSSLINLTLGVIYGGISGFAGGRVDDIMMRIVDIIYAVPIILIVIMLMVLLRPGLNNVFLALGIAYWLVMARIVRGQILSLKEQEFVLAARALGANPWRILLRHLIPNSIGPIVVTATLRIPQAIFLEAFLSYIGLGVSAPMASWGVLASEGVQSIRSYPWQILFPSGAIAFAMLGFNFVADGLRDALDPRLRKG
ncbi:MAG: ABC transporter permease [Actinobacteria bacterium]|nr:ABC transporter permease [Actinomycetota bacterium]